MPPWGDDVERIYESVSHGELEPDEERTLHDADFSEEQLRELFDEGFLTHEGDASAQERFDAREAFFEWMEYLGYDRDDFNWQAWREHMGYE